MIEKGEHLQTDKIVSIDVEYGGGRTIPRIAITNFDDDVIYYSDFCLRYEDWVETKLTECHDDDGKDEPMMLYSEKPTTVEVASNVEGEAGAKEGQDNEDMADCEENFASDDEDL